MTTNTVKTTKKQDKTFRKIVKNFRKQELDELYIVWNYLMEFSRVFFNQLKFDDKLFENLEEEVKKFDNINVINWASLRNFVKMYLVYKSLPDDTKIDLWNNSWIQGENK